MSRKLEQMQREEVVYGRSAAYSYTKKIKNWCTQLCVLNLTGK